MWVAIVVLAIFQVNQAVILPGKQSFPTEEACMDQLAKSLNGFRQNLSPKFGEGYLVNGKCLEAQAAPQSDERAPRFEK